MARGNDIRSIDGVCEVEVFDAAPAADGTPGRSNEGRPPVAIELPHAATREADFERLRARLDPSLPDDLRDFFFVNTDAGSYEYGRQVARTLANAGHAAVLVRCLIPRTFVDCNRIVEGAGERGTAGSAAHGITAAVPDYIRRPADLELLLSLHRAYQSVASAAIERACTGGGLALTLHTYAPKTVGIDRIDEGIGAALRRAYEPAAYATWPERPEIDLITADEDGRRLASGPLVEGVTAAFAAAGRRAGENATYCLHKATMGWLHSSRHPGQVLCMEARRDLLADPFTPFDEMRINPEKATRIARPLAEACIRHLASPKR